MTINPPPVPGFKKSLSTFLYVNLSQLLTQINKSPGAQKIPYRPPIRAFLPCIFSNVYMHWPGNMPEIRPGDQRGKSPDKNIKIRELFRKIIFQLL